MATEENNNDAPKAMTYCTSPSTTGYEHPIIRLKHRACQLSGVSFDDAHEIDAASIYSEINELLMTSLIEKFYTRVDADLDIEFRNMFKHSPFEERVQNLTDFMMQRIGGPSYYTEQRGHHSLMHRHAYFIITSRSAEKWLEHFEIALEGTPEIQESTAKKLMNFLRYSAYFLVASQDSTNVMEHMADYDFVKPSITRDYEEKINSSTC